MRILFVSSSSGSQGGGELFLLYLGRALVAKGHEVVFWLSEHPAMDALARQLERIGPVHRQAYRNTFLRPLRSFTHLLPGGAQAGILRRWRDIAPDVIHLNKQCLEDGLDLLALASHMPCRRACTIHITQSAVELRARFGRLRDWVARRALLRFRGAIWAISAQRAEALGRFLGRPEPVDFVANGVDVNPDDLGKVRSCPQGEAFQAVAVGRLEPQKNPMRFLRWAAQLKAVRPDLQATWVGDGRMRPAFDAAIDEMGGRDWIRCVGWVNDARPYLAQADVVLHPADFEGLPFALLEAMAQAKPCVLTPQLAAELKDIPQSTWIIAHGDDPSWTRLASDGETLLRLGRSSFEIVLSRFSFATMAEAYVRLYQRLKQDESV